MDGGKTTPYEVVDTQRGEFRIFYNNGWLKHGVYLKQADAKDEAENLYKHKKNTDSLEIIYGGNYDRGNDEKHEPKTRENNET